MRAVLRHGFLATVGLAAHATSSSRRQMQLTMPFAMFFATVAMIATNPFAIVTRWRNPQLSTPVRDTSNSS